MQLVFAAFDAAEILKSGIEVAQLVKAGWDENWNTVVDSSSFIYRAITGVASIFAVASLIAFMLKWGRDLMERGNMSPLAEIVWPLVVIILLANNGSLTADLTRAMRSTINIANQSVLREAQLGEAIQRANAFQGFRVQLGAAVKGCESQPDPEKRDQCIEQRIQEFESNVASQPDQVLRDLGSSLATGVRQSLVAVPVVGALAILPDIFELAVRTILLGSQFAFQNLMEMSLLLTGLLGPIAVATSLLPIGAKPIFAWLTGFYSIGMAKLSYNIMIGLVAQLRLNVDTSAGGSFNPVNWDDLGLMILTALLSPVLALALASGGGFAVWSAINSAASAAASAAVGGAKLLVGGI